MDIYYKVKGTGYPIICLHGNGENHHIFDELVNTIDGYQWILIDSRYHGQSTHQGELSYQQMAQDVMSVVNELQIESYDIIGFSDGGITALLLALEDERLKHMVVIGANTRPNMLKIVFRIFDYIQMFCLLPFCLYHPQARLTFRLTKLMETQPHIEYTRLQSIHIPTLILAGEHDIVKEEDTRAIGQSIPYSVVKIIPNGNHSLLRDYFKPTVKEIKLFLDVCHKEEKP